MLIRGNDKHPTLADWSAWPQREDVRAAMGHTLSYWRRMNLADMTPTDDAKVCSTRYCLQNPGVEYLVFQPQNDVIGLHLPAGTWQLEWFNPREGTVVQTGQATLGEGKQNLRSPRAGPAVRFLKAMR